MMAAEDMQRQLIGAWRLMLGRSDGIARLDLTSDGFWNSFLAILVAAPALILSWVAIAHEIDPLAAGLGGRFLLIARLGLVDIGTWVLPLVLLAALAPISGISDRFVPYVVASNWASAIFVWMTVPATLFSLLPRPAADVASTLSTVAFIASMVLTWRLTHVVLARGAAVATAVFTAMFLASLVALFALQSVLGITIPEIPVG